MTTETLTNLFEALTIFCFGLSWPISIRKSIVSRTAKGKSLFFEVFLLIGYAFGIARKIIQIAVLNHHITFANLEGWIFFLSFIFYVLNFIEIAVDVGLFFRNTKLDRLADMEHTSKHVITVDEVAKEYIPKN